MTKEKKEPGPNWKNAYGLAEPGSTEGKQTMTPKQRKRWRKKSNRRLGLEAGTKAPSERVRNTRRKIFNRKVRLDKWLPQRS